MDAIQMFLYHGDKMMNENAFFICIENFSIELVHGLFFKLSEWLVRQIAIGANLQSRMKTMTRFWSVAIGKYPPFTTTTNASTVLRA